MRKNPIDDLPDELRGMILQVLEVNQYDPTAITTFWFREIVLQDFKGDDAILMREVADKAADAVEVWLKEGIDAAMTRFNGDVQKLQPVAPFL